MQSDEKILFQGLKFDLKVSKTRPELFENEQLTVPKKFEHFLNFLNEMNEFGVLENKERNSLIIYADD